MILGISTDGSHARGVLMDPGGAVTSRAESTQPSLADAIGAVAKELGIAAGGQLEAAAVSFPDPDPKTQLADLSFLATVIGKGVPLSTLSTGNASARARARKISSRSRSGPAPRPASSRTASCWRARTGLRASVQWLALNPVERDDYRRLGCLEAEGGSAGIVRRLVWRIKSGDRSRVLDTAGGDYNAITLDSILTAVRDNDGVSISVIRDTVKYLAMAVSNIAAVIDPDVIVRGGILQSAGDLLLEPIRQECARRMPPGMTERVRIEVLQLGPDAAPMGTARLAKFGAVLP